jgi:FkbM family methyltransferase
MNIFKTLKFINNHPIARRHRVKAFSRFFKWQVSQKMHPHPVEYPFIGHTKLWIKKGMTGATGNIYTGLHDFEDMSFLLHFLREEDLFIDIGANIGSYTILAAGVAKASCIAIEPVPQTFEILEKNITINELRQKVTALNIGIGSQNEILYFTRHLDVVNHVVLNHDVQQDLSLIQVTGTSLDELLKNRQSPSLIKIDVEGFEQEVMTGAAGLLNNTDLKAIIIELNGSGGRYGFDEKKIHEQLKGYGFNMYEYEPFSRTLLRITDFGNLNTIYIKDIDFVRARLKDADAINVFSEHY